MFTGLIEELGTVRGVRQAGRSLHLTVSARVVVQDAKLGDSIAVNGVCLTVVKFDGSSFTADVMPETYEKTALRHLTPGSPVNLERTMQAGGRFGGHMVQGHVDGVGTIVGVKADEIARLVTISAAPAVTRYVIPKGSIAIDGISLTVVSTDKDRFSVSLIPHTAAVTTLGRKQEGDLVNLEADVLGKYIEKFIAARFGEVPGAGTGAGPESGGLTTEFLARHGFMAGD